MGRMMTKWCGSIFCILYVIASLLLPYIQDKPSGLHNLLMILMGVASAVFCAGMVILAYRSFKQKRALPTAVGLALLTACFSIHYLRCLDVYFYYMNLQL